MWVWLVATALAQMEVCPGVYDNDQLLTDLDGIDASFKALDLDGTRERIKHVHRMMLCLESPVDPRGVARFGRQLSLAFFFDQDEDALKRWALMARTTADLPWHADLAPDHPFREAVDAFEIPDDAGPDAALLVPKKAMLYRNGVAITTAVAPIEVPALVQLDDKGEWRIWWQDGSAFPEDLLTDPGPPLELPKGYVAAEGNPVHVEHAGLPLFGEAIELPDEPKAELVADAAEIEQAKREDVAGEYTDPFADARKRAIRRQYFETTETNEAGDTITRKTEVLTFAPEDRSGGKAVTYEIFQYWLDDHPEWKPDAARQAGKADATYLSDWVDGRPPPNASRSPLVWVPWAAARAYCASFDKALGSGGSDEMSWEWTGASPKRTNAKGKLKAEKKALSGRSDTGFRCATQ